VFRLNFCMYFSSFPYHYAIFSRLLFNSSFLVQNILLATWFCNTLNLCSSLNVTDDVSHPYKGQVKLYLGVKKRR
jgi:hypothetical protein